MGPLPQLYAMADEPPRRVEARAHIEASLSALIERSPQARYGVDPRLMGRAIRHRAYPTRLDTVDSTVVRPSYHS